MVSNVKQHLQLWYNLLETIDDYIVYVECSFQEQQYSHVPDDHLCRLLENVMSYIEQGIGKRFGSLSTFLLQLNPTCLIENKRKNSSRTNQLKILRFELHECYLCIYRS
jgi:hypothetical protein